MSRDVRDELTNGRTAASFSALYAAVGVWWLQ